MNNRQHAASVADFARAFATEKHEAPEILAGRIIASVLHWAMREGEMIGEDGRKSALAAAKHGISGFISDVHSAGANRPSCYTLITVRTDNGLWVSETGYEEMVQ